MMDNLICNHRYARNILVILGLLLWTTFWSNSSKLEFVQSQSDSNYAVLADIGMGQLYAVAWHPTDPILALGNTNGFALYSNELEQISEVALGYPVYSLSWSPDGTRLATGGSKVQVWNIASLQSEFLLDVVADVYWNPSSLNTVAVNKGTTVEIWDISNNQLVSGWDVEGNIWSNAVAWSPDGRYMAYAVSGILTIVDTQLDLNTVFELPAPVWFSSITWSPDGQKIATAYQHIDIWDISIGHVDTISGENYPITGLAWNSMGIVSTTETDPSIYIWDLTSGNIGMQLDGNEGSTYLDISTDGAYLATIHFDSSLKIWYLPQQEFWASLYLYGGQFQSASWNSAGTRLATVDGSTHLKIWDTRQGSFQTTIGNNSNYTLRAVSWSPNGELLAAAGGYSSIYVWDSNTSELLLNFVGDSELILDILWSPDSGRIATIGSKYGVKIWNLNTQQLESTLQIADTSTISVSWSPDGSLIATSGVIGGVQIWATESGVLETLIGQDLVINDIAWGYAENRIAVATPIMLYILDIDTGEFITSINVAIKNIAWNWFDETIVGTNNGSIVLVGTLSGEIETIATNLTDVKTVVWEPSTYRGAVLTQGEQIRIWGPPPHATTLISPSQIITTNTPSYSWQDISGASSYQLQVSDLEDSILFEETYPFTICQNGICSVEPPIALPDGAYTWQVQAINAAGSSPWSEPLSFTVETCINDPVALETQIVDANASGVPTTLCLSQNSIQTFTIPDNNLNTLPVITGDITIEGNEATLTRNPSAAPFRFFEIAPGGSLTLNNLTLSNGEVDAQGGAILNNGTLTLNGSTLEGNFASEHGGAIYNNSTLTIANTAFNDNHTNRYAGVGDITLPYGYGGAIENSAGATATINGSTFDDNGSD